jgi:hypothetical protein
MLGRDEPYARTGSDAGSDDGGRHDTPASDEVDEVMACGLDRRAPRAPAGGHDAGAPFAELL